MDAFDIPPLYGTQTSGRTGVWAHRNATGSAAWTASIGLVLALGIVSGGSSEASSAVFNLFRLACVALLACAIIRLVATSVTFVERYAITLAAGTIVLVILHLLPLPYSVFALLPGREYVATVFSVAGIEAKWMPVTLSPAATWACLLALLPPLAIFLATLTADHRSRWLIVVVMLLGVIANVVLGLAQRFQGPKSSLYLYDYVNFGLATGFFSNRNNFAVMLCVSIPLIWALTQKSAQRQQSSKSIIIVAVGAIMMGLVLLGLAVSASRSGILLGMLALVLSTVMVWSPSSSRKSRRARHTLLTLLAAALIIGQFGMIGILRIVETDPVTEYRTQIRDVTLRAASEYLPVGSGFGTFRDVYGMHETPETMLTAYVNHAHNDWLELWLEGGLPAAFLMTAFVVLFVWQAARVWTPRAGYAANVLARAASIGTLVLLLHSLVEYPLRMPALASVFATLLALMLGPPNSKPMPRRNNGNSIEPSPQSSVAQLSSTPPVFEVEGFNKHVGARGKPEVVR